MRTQALREIAKFFCGVTAWESFVHASLLGSHANPVVFGITMTDTLNLVQIYIPAIVSIALGFFAWFRRSKAA